MKKRLLFFAIALVLLVGGAGGASVFASVSELREAAGQGDVGAQYELGRAYSTGEGVARDESEAVRWYREAAGQGDAGAQFRLGEAYYFGRGVVVDRREAVRWYRKAAEQGHAEAQSYFRKVFWLSIAKASRMKMQQTF